MIKVDAYHDLIRQNLIVAWTQTAAAAAAAAVAVGIVAVDEPRKATKRIVAVIGNV
jgi:hypothetical protein